MDRQHDQGARTWPMLPGGATGTLVRDYKGEEPIGW
jgi:hypothetical protein